MARLKFECGDGFKVVIHKGNGIVEVKETTETMRKIFPIEITLMWRKDKYCGIGFGWLGYWVTIKIIK